MASHRDIYDKSTEGQNLSIIGRNIDGGLSWSPQQPFMANSDRLKVSMTRTLLATRNAYDNQPQLFQVVENVNGSVSYNGADDSSDLQIGTAAGDKLYYSTNEFFHYQSYREAAFGFGVILPPHQDGQRVRIGSFSEQDGIYLERDTAGEMFIVRRSSATGSTVEERIPQSEWNVNTFLSSEATTYQGNNPSGIVLDDSKIMMLKTGFMWYGGGSAWLGFDIGGIIHIAHRFNAGNRIAEPIFGEPTVPVRYEIENVSSVSSVSAIRKYGVSATSESGEDEDVGFAFSADTGTTLIPVSTGLQRIITLRPKSVFKSKTNRTKVEPSELHIFASGNSAVRFMYAINTPYTNTPTWNDVHDDSAAEYSLDATGANIGGNGGLPVRPLILPIGGGSKTVARDSKLGIRIPLVVKADGSNEFNVALFAQGLSGSADVWCGIEWKEIQ